MAQELAGLKAQAVSIGEEEAKVDGYTSGGLVALVRKGPGVNLTLLFTLCARPVPGCQGSLYGAE